MRQPVLRRLAVAVLAGAVALTAAACTRRAPALSDDPMADMPGMAHAHAPSAKATPAVAPADPAGTGLSASSDGYTFVPSTAGLAAGAAGTFTFHVTGPDGHAVTSYQPYESKLVQVSLIRSDLTGFRYLDAAMNQDGLWSAPLPALPAGTYRAFVTFAAPDAAHGTPLRYDLSRPLTVTGPTTTPGVPSTVDSTRSTVDGYAVTLSGAPRAGRQAPLTVTVAKDGHPVESFNRYLDGYAHLTAFRAGDLARARIDSAAAIGQGGELTARATFPESGSWRVFAQFDQGGAVRTAEFTLTVS